MNGMKKKAQRRQHAKQYTADGLPRDTNAWTVKDWCDLYRGMEAIKRKIAARHRQERNPT